jgi:hypothetical protein
MTDDHEHGDATLDVIALLEAAIRGDDDGHDAIIKGLTEHGSIEHVIGTLTGTHAHMMIPAFGGREAALRRLAEERGEIAVADDNEHVHIHEREDEDEGSVQEGLSYIGTEINDLNESIVRLTDAVARVGDILDKRLA